MKINPIDNRNSIRAKAHKLTADARPKTLYEYTVTGNGDFAFDMLRYDAAYPADSESASALTYTDYFQVRTVRLRSYREPTIGRWQSFGWNVHPVKDQF